MKRLLKLALLFLLLTASVTSTFSQSDCTLYQDNHLCYTGEVGCTSGGSFSSAGQSANVATYSCSTSNLTYIGVCDSGSSPQDDQLLLYIDGQVVSENEIATGAEVVKIYPITLQPGSYTLRLSVLRDSDPPATYRIVASTSRDEVNRQLSDVCGTDFSSAEFKPEGTGRLIVEPIPIIAYSAYTADMNNDGYFTNADSANIFLYDAFLRKELQVTAGDVIDSDPTWAPDGKSIVFSSIRRGTGSDWAIFSVPVTGGEPTQLTDGNDTHWQPEYSPDGSVIATACYQTSICLMNPDGSNLRNITQQYISRGVLWDPNWSPDGSRILVVGKLEDTNTIESIDGCDEAALYVMNSDGSNLQRVSQPGLSVFGGGWSRDGSQIIYYAGWETGNGYECAFNDEAALGIINLNNGSDTILIPRGRFLRRPAISNDMSFATFTAPNGDTNGDGYLDARDSEGLVVYVFDDGTQRRLDIRETELFDPDWAPPDITELPENVTVFEPPPPLCAVRAFNAAKLRSGPGTNYADRGTMSSGPNEAQGQAFGTDGFTWWKLKSGLWVRSDLVEEIGECETLPHVSP